MLSMRLVSRGNLPQYATKVQRLHTSTLLHDSSNSSSSDSSSSDSDKKVSKKALKSKPVQSDEQVLQSRQDTADRLNSLLDRIMKQPKLAKSIHLSMPPKKPKPEPKPKKQPYEQTLVEAAKQVATTLGGDVEKTELELLDKLLLTEKKKSNDQGQKKPPVAPLSLSEFVSGMKIDRTPAMSTMSHHMMRRSDQAQAVSKKFESIRPSNFERRRSDSRERFGGSEEPGNLYGGAPLAIFDDLHGAKGKFSETPDTPRLTTWQILEEKEFKLAQTHPPENIFQEMILWTEQGKLWKFPIDNEQGMEEEQSVHFSEHVFMERHLQDWCPKRGPIRHFMELVCVGLSKNPYMTVNEKKGHIAWYREFFGSKQELLKEIGAVDGEVVQKSKQIEA